MRAKRTRMIILAATAGFFLCLTGPNVSRTQQPAPPGLEQLPKGALQRIGSGQFRHASRIQCLAYSPDGKILAAGGGDDVLRLWDAETGKLIRSFNLTWVQALAFSGDGKQLAAASAGRTVQVWNVATGETRGPLPGHTGPVRALAFAVEDNLLVSAGQDGTIRVWDYKVSKERGPLRGHEDEITCLAVAPDGFTVVSGSGDYTLRWWNVRSGELIRTIDASAGVTAVIFNGDGKKLISAGDDGVIRVWDAEGTEVKNWDGHQDAVLSLIWKKDGKMLISSGYDNHIYFWNIASGEKKQAIAAPVGDAQAMALSPGEDVLAYAGKNHLIHRWSLTQDKPLSEAGGPRGAVVCLAISPDEKYLAYGDSTDHVCLLETATLQELHRWPVPGVKNLVLTFSPDGKLLAGATGAGDVQLWHVPSGKEHHLLKSPQPDQVHCLAFAPAGNTLAVGCRKGGIHLFNTATGKLSKSHFTRGEDVFALAYSPDGQLLAFALADRVEVQKIGLLGQAATTPLFNLAEKQRAASLAFSPDGKALATGHFDSMIHLWNLKDGEKIQTFEGHESAVYGLTFSGTGRRLLSCSYDRTIRLWEPFDELGKTHIATWTGQIGPVYSVAFSPDGRRAYSANAAASIILWDVTQRSPDGKLPAAKLTPAQLETLWLELASDDAAIAHRAMWTLIAGGEEGIEFLHRRVFLVDRNELDKLITELDSDKYEIRTKASKTLAGYGQWIEGRLEEACKDPISLEQKLRLDLLLSKLRGEKGLTLEQERARLKRAMEILEQVNSARSRELLANLSKGAAETAMAEEAAVSLKRAEKK